jgi:hypothetical protein
MARPTIQSKNFNFEVVQVPLQTPDGRFSGFYGNQRVDTGKTLGVTSEQYGIIQNKALIDAAKDALGVRGMTDYEESVLVTGNGERLYASFTFKNRQIANAVGDLFGYVLTLKNSFDRTLRAAIELSLMRLTCLNGASTLDSEYNATRKHSSGISVDFLGGAIDSAIENAPKALEIYNRLAAVELGDEAGRNFLHNLVKRKLISERSRVEIEPLWLNPRLTADKPRNVYNLYNAITSFATHNPEMQGRLEMARDMGSGILLALANAIKTPERMAAMTAPVIIDV